MTDGWVRARGPGALLVVGLFAGVAVSGCFGEIDRYYYSFDPDEQYVNPGVFEGRYGEGDANGSSVLFARLWLKGDPEIFHLRSQSPHRVLRSQSESAVDSTVFITVAVWIPNNGTDGTYPTIVVASPYHELAPNGDIRVPNPGGSTLGFLLKNYFPLGYAVAAISVRGTGTSGGCMELMGAREAADLDQAIKFLGQQEWSNERIGMIGVSYDGSTPYLVAAQGNPYLRTLVPISGLPDQFDLMFRNGTSETRGPIMHSLVYWPYGFSSRFPLPGVATPKREDYQDRQNLLCDDAVKGALMGPYASFLGERGTSITNYYAERDYRARVLANYNGSVFMVHGLQDWNADPHVAIPFTTALRAQGLEVKEWYGQWGHAAPDRGSCGKESPRWLILPCRLDFAETLRHWFEYYLKGNTTSDRGPWVQIQDNRGHWRNADTIPSPNATWLELYPHAGQLGAERNAQERAEVLLPPAEFGMAVARNGPVQWLEYKTEPLDRDVRISGLPQLRVAFEPTTQGGFVGAWLMDENGDGRVLDRWFQNTQNGKWEPFSLYGVPPVVGHGQLDLRYYQGGEQRQTLTPGQRYVAKVELEPLDILVPKGHRLTLWILQYKYPDKFAGTSPGPIRVVTGGNNPTVLRLPTIEIDPFAVFRVPGSHFPDPKYFERLHAPKPDYANLFPNVTLPFRQGACWDALATLAHDEAPNAGLGPGHPCWGLVD